MLPVFKKLVAVSIYTPDPEGARGLYLGLGLEPLKDPTFGEQDSLALRFQNGEACLILHDDRQRQFTEIVVSVEDLPATYDRLARNSDYIWLETPYVTAGSWKAVVKLPDDNVFTLLGPVATPLETPKR